MLTFERGGQQGGFLRHIMKDHNLWQYVYYIVHLNSKNSSDYDGIESYIGEKFDAADNFWMPNGTALCLEDGHSSVANGVDNDKVLVDNMYQRLKDCVKQLKDMSEKIDR